MKCKTCGKAIIHEEYVCGSCVSDINREVFEGGWWIDTEDDLPLVGRDVLTATHAKSLVIGHLQKDGEWSHTCLVTHWQRLPDVPMSGCR